MDHGVRGHPLHSRSLSVPLTQPADGRLDVFGEIPDLRKRGFVPVGEGPPGCSHILALGPLLASPPLPPPLPS